jgi:hypothetical protein
VIHDLQRTTRFTYWRCSTDGGQLITFNQFLRAKNFIRTPTPAELAKLRLTVRQITCSQCGAPVDLSTDSACTHCGSPVALIDPDSVTRALQDLSAGSATPSSVSPDAMRTTLSDAQIDAIFKLQRMPERDADSDLVAIGAVAIAVFVGLRVSLSRQIADLSNVDDEDKMIDPDDRRILLGRLKNTSNYTSTPSIRLVITEYKAGMQKSTGEKNAFAFLGNQLKLKVQDTVFDQPRIGTLLY